MPRAPRPLLSKWDYTGAWWLSDRGWKDGEGKLYRLKTEEKDVALGKVRMITLELDL